MCVFLNIKTAEEVMSRGYFHCCYPGLRQLLAKGLKSFGILVTEVVCRRNLPDNFDKKFLENSLWLGGFVAEQRKLSGDSSQIPWEITGRLAPQGIRKWHGRLAHGFASERTPATRW